MPLQSVVKKCSCGCGGSVEIEGSKLVMLEINKHKWCQTLYITGHEPEGIAGKFFRTGPRAKIQASA